MTSLSPGSATSSPPLGHGDPAGSDSLAGVHDHDGAHGGHTSGHPDHRLFGLGMFLVADGMTFAGFFAAYLTFRAVNPLPSGSSYELELLLPSINTVLLLVSSVTFHRAGSALKAGDGARSRRWLLISAALGLTFLAAQLKEYFSLPFGLTDNLFASTFYAITGFHGLHVSLGALMILIVWWQSRPGGSVNRDNPFPLEATELYWHFVDGIWVVLYGLLYLL